MSGAAMLYRYPTDRAPCAIVGQGDSVLVEMPCGHSTAYLIAVFADNADREFAQIRCTCCGHHGFTLAETLMALPAGWRVAMPSDRWAAA